jgi:hypothetical protein
MEHSEQIRIADILWRRLVEEFNAEAKTYDSENPQSRLGSVGKINRREVCRPDWWKTLGGEKLIQSSYDGNRGVISNRKAGDGFEDYWEITHIIEGEHQGEHLETGIISFGS